MLGIVVILLPNALRRSWKRSRKETIGAMKQITQNFRSGDLSLQEVPAPSVRDGGVLVHNAFSLISAGTERMAMDLAKKSLLGKARERPDLVRQLVQKARNEGVAAAIQKAKSRLD